MKTFRYDWKDYKRTDIETNDWRIFYKGRRIGIARNAITLEDALTLVSYTKYPERDKLTADRIIIEE